MVANGLTIAQVFYVGNSSEVLIFVGVAINVPRGLLKLEILVQPFVGRWVSVWR
jgi:hypothetical protein